MQTQNDPRILIIGAGPVGLTMACELARQGVPSRIVDREPESSKHSKALAIFPRTLEMLELMGVAESILAQGERIEGMVVHHHGKEVAKLSFTSLPTRFPFAISLPQNQTEASFIANLQSLGGQVERGLELTGLTQTAQGLNARLRRPNGEEEESRPQWLVACDGAHSTVRHQLGLSFGGELDDAEFVLADVHFDANLTHDRVHLFLAQDGLLGVFPCRATGWRIVASVPPGDPNSTAPVPTRAEVQGLVNQRGFPGISVSEPTWVSRFRVSHRKVQHFRVGRVFLAGDAAHVHSPAGGQGMNTGIQDAVNLAWKLARVVDGRAPQSLLDSYDIEREPVARGVLAFTDRLTQVATADSAILQMLRNLLLPALSGIPPLERKAAARMAELTVDYRRSPISVQQGSGKPEAGDRAPETSLQDPGSGKDVRIIELLRKPRWVLLMFAGGSETNREKIMALRSRITEFTGDLETYGVSQSAIAGNGWLVDPDNSVHIAYGCSDGGLILIRPDAYIGFRSDALERSALQEYFGRVFTAAVPMSGTEPVAPHFVGRL
jgi:2-polyprenyl-6-methoxyphenol hydroxylase-like FAD-dependent oxidoreductase